MEINENIFLYWAMASIVAIGFLWILGHFIKL
jgi:hypothetical protein